MGFLPYKSALADDRERPDKEKNPFFDPLTPTLSRRERGKIT
jgi:hypothetical protein